MSRIAKSPIDLPAGVEVKISGQDVSVKGSKGNLDVTLNAAVNIKQNDNVLNFEPKNAGRTAWAQAGTARALVANMVKGVSQGFERRLTLIGVGYRTNVKGSTVNLTLGFSHPVEYQLPEGITAEAPSQTELIIKGSDKQKVGQVCAEIRAFRPPEPYKGKGVRYSDENVRRKEAKKK